MIGRRTLMNVAQLLVLFAALNASLGAQWSTYPTRGVPKTKDGKPDLSAPAPRPAVGNTDPTGLREAGRGPGRAQRRTPSNAPIPAETLPAPPPTADGSPPVATFFNLGAGFKEGLPFTPW